MKNRPLKESLYVLLACAAVLCSTGCTTRVADFSVVSQGTPHYERMPKVPKTSNIEATDSRLWFLFIPLSNTPRIDEAMDRCFDKVGYGDFMERARVYRTSWSIILLSYGSYTVIGDIGDTKQTPTKPATDAREK